MLVLKAVVLAGDCLAWVDVSFLVVLEMVRMQVLAFPWVMAPEPWVVMKLAHQVSPASQ